MKNSNTIGKSQQRWNGWEEGVKDGGVEGGEREESQTNKSFSRAKHIGSNEFEFTEF